MAPVQYHESFRAMDTAIDVIIEADRPPVAGFLDVRLLFEQQEERFSRFRPSSLLSGLNRGEPVTDGWFAAGCRLAVEAWEVTGGLFNPLILASLEAAGYDRTFREVAGGHPSARAVPGLPGVLTVDGDSVTLREGTMDLGGIVKGWTVDVAVTWLLETHRSFLVNAGGDLRCEGAEEGVDGWRIAVDGAGDGVAWEGAVRGAVATSTTLRRAWQTDAGARAHHLIDPRTGLPSESGIVQATVFADETWLAEAWAKAIVIGGESIAERAGSLGYRVLTITADDAARGRGGGGLTGGQ